MLPVFTRGSSGPVRRLVALDAFGLADTSPEQAPGRLEKWLRDLAAPAVFRRYADEDALAARLQSDNPASVGGTGTLSRRASG